MFPGPGTGSYGPVETYFLFYIIRVLTVNSNQGFFQPFDKIKLYGLLGGEQVCIHVANGGVWGHAPQGNFGFGSFTGRNLVESVTVFAQT